MALKVQTSEKGPGTYVILTIGSLDTNTYQVLDDEISALLEKSAKMIVFDMEYLDYISSAGISVILRARKALKKNEGQVMMVNLQPQIKKVFEIIKALPGQSIFRSVEELDSYLDSMQKKVVEGDD
jgi:anti-anti-sigma factor